MKQLFFKKYLFIALSALFAVLSLAACGQESSSSASPSVPSSSVSAPRVSSPAPSAASSSFVYVPPVDFSALRVQGPDIIAWLTLDGANIDSAVTLGIDNAYYLTHDAYGKAFAGGTPFIDMSNAADFSDPVTLIYGHVMPDGTIFSQLLRYKDPDFFAQNREMALHLPGGLHTYEIFAAFPHDDSNFLYEKDYTDPAAFAALLDYIAQKESGAPEESNLASVAVTPADKLLLLSTCDNEGPSRYIVAGKLVSAV